ncbi:MAG TPA: hypothetical protein PKG54_09105 [Phycisphaerae bacterium]|nr:hypothetical protein [Phycisphaerae bacterium]HOB74673.1 hypothetical protein [Phycisphaerae bacterium]HOJ53614.1 hypothetical protein [Phycisphaerae bacterium]HOL26339.1 hypothetical protein [Phycisphaerae bacterium]HPP22508.1 hypothetical protein [Phycisphaerae bacterium]
MSRNRRDQGSRSRNLGQADKRPRRDDKSARNAPADAKKPEVDEKDNTYLMGSLREPARAPGDFGRDIGDETDLWI